MISPSLSEITVRPAVFVATTVGSTKGVMVVDSPSGSTVSIGVVIPSGKVIAVLALEITVSPAESVVSTINSVGVIVVTSPSVKVAVTGLVTSEEIVMAPSD